MNYSLTCRDGAFKRGAKLPGRKPKGDFYKKCAMRNKRKGDYVLWKRK